MSTHIIVLIVIEHKTCLLYTSMKLQKFENVDVIASLEAIMKQNTAFYQSDFDIDKQILQKAAVSPVPEDKRLLWFSRPSGTCCFRERDVFLKDTRQHNTWRFYGCLLYTSDVYKRQEVRTPTRTQNEKGLELPPPAPPSLKNW